MIKRKNRPNYFLKINAALLSAILLFGMLSQTVQAANVTITAVYSSFTGSNVSAFKFNVAATQSGSAIVLTTANYQQSGTAWWKNKVNLNSQRSFSSYFSFKFSGAGGMDPGGGDGITFALQTQSNAAGASGGGLGYGGITPSVAIEYDDWQNTGVIADINANHIGLDVNGSVTSVQSVSADSVGQLKNGSTYYTWIDYNGVTDSLQVRLSTTSTRPAGALLSATVDLVSYINQDVYVGFTGGTYGAFQKQEIDSFYFNNDYLAAGIDTNVNTYTAGPAIITASASPATGPSSTISAIARDISGNVMSGQVINFTTNLGSVSPAGATTNGSGIATTTLTNNSAGNATVRATGAGGAYGETTVENSVITAVYPSFNSGNIGAFQFNGMTNQSGSAIILTDAAVWKYGSAWWKNKVTLANQRSFSAQFSFKMPGAGTSDSYYPAGADGIVFAIQTQSSGAGSAGGGMGYAGITPSVGIEFDNFQNSGGGTNDPDGNHIAIDINGSINSNATTAAGALTTAGITLDDGNKYYAWVDYNGTSHLIEVRISSTLTRPATAALSYTYDLSTVFNQDVYVGFTAATGGSYAQHEIDSFYFNHDFGSLDPQNVNYVAGPTSVTVSASPTAGTASTISALVKDVNGAIMAGQNVSFTTTLGTLDTASAITATNGIAQVNLSNSAAGTATVRATGSGGAYGETTVTLLYATTTTLSSPSNPSVYGQSVSITAHVASSGGTPAGSVTFWDGTTSLGSVGLSGGNAIYSSSAFIIGSHNITAVYATSGNYYTSTSSILLQVVNKAGTTTALSHSTGTTVYGQAFTLTATVSASAPGAGTPTGTVTFYDSGASLGSGTLNGSRQTTISVSTLTTGNHTNVTAVYNADSNFNTSTSSAVSQTVNKAATSTALVSLINPSGLGQSVTFRATVTASAPGSGTPTGSVSFSYEGGPLGSGNLNGSGQATYATNSLLAGSHTITAVYNADSNFNTSTSNTVSQTVNTSGTNTVLVSSDSSSANHQSVTFTASITAANAQSGTPTGSVRFDDWNTEIGTGNLDSNGITSINISTLAPGRHYIYATYTGDSNFNSSFAEVVQDVDHDATTTVLNHSPASSVYGQAVTFSVAVTANLPATGTPTGSVSIFDDISGFLGTGVLNGSGQATFSISYLEVGSHNLSAQYSGDANYATSTSTNLSHIVSAAGTSTTVTSSVNPAAYGQSIIFSAAVTIASPGQGTPTGSVQFYIDSSTYGFAVSLSNGNASAPSINSLAIGNHTISATYLPDPDFITSTSGSLTQVVTKVSTSTLLRSSAYPIVQGESVTFTATVTGVIPGTPGGSVTFQNNGVPLGTVDLTNGEATFSTSSLDAGNYSITVVYNPDNTHTGSTSNILSPTSGVSSVGGSFTAVNLPAVIAPWLILILTLVPGGVLVVLKRRKKNN